MGILKLIIAFLVIGAIVVIISEVLKRKNKEKMVEDLNDEMDTVNDSLHRTNIEEDVIDAKTQLKARRATLAAKEADLEKPAHLRDDAPVEFTGDFGVPEAAEISKAKNKAAPKKKVAKKKVAKKKAVRKPGNK